MLAIIQFDSPSMSLVQRMLQEGRLPTLARLCERGHMFTLDAETRLFEAALFPTLYSGVEVGNHGLYSAFPWSPSEQRVRFMQDFPQPTAAWERLARAGKRSLVIDPYQVWPPREMAGIFLSGWQLENRMVMPRTSNPREELRNLSRRFGTPPPGELVFGKPGVPDLIRQRNSLVEAARRLADAAVHLLSREKFDLVWLAFSCIHLAGHGLWDISSVDGHTTDATRGLLERALSDVYAASDAALTRIVQALAPGSDIIVCSPDGMGADTSCSDLLPEMLEAVLRSPSSESKNAPGSGVWRLRARVPPWCRRAIARALGDTRARDAVAQLHFQRVDWTRTRAIAVPGDFSGFVRLNLRGRERNGIVEPGVEAEQLLTEISNGLTTFRHTDGSACVAGVERVPESIRRGRYGDRLPDLVVRWSERSHAPVQEVHSPGFGRVARQGAGTGLAGNHAGGAWALVLPGSSRLRTPARPPQIVDIAATSCSLFNADMTGLAGEPLLQN